MKANALRLGSVVVYKGEFYVALENRDGLVKIIAPHKGQAKLNVSRKNVQVTNIYCRRVDVNHKDMLVSPNGTVISLVSQRVLKNTSQDAKAAMEYVKTYSLDADDYRGRDYT